MNNNDMNTYHMNGNALNSVSGGASSVGGGGGGDELYEKNGASIEDDDYEPCTKRIMPCLFAWCLLISSSAAYFIVVLPMYIEILGNSRFTLFILIVVVHSILLIFVVINFVIATFMDPGRYPKVDVSDGLEPNDVIANVQTTAYKNVLINDINVRMKWCTTCQFYRPPRSSHCGVCNACIDTMDHHCPWVCNCIARRNYRYFLQFLISLTIHMLIVLGLSLAFVLLKKERGLTNIPIMVAIFLVILVTILIIPIGGLTGFHLILVSRGRTTNEQVTGKFRTGVNPFDEGCISNWSRTMCPSLPPSYIEAKRKKQARRDYLQTRMLLKLQMTHSSAKSSKNSSNNTKHKIMYQQNQRGSENNSSIKIISTSSSNQANRSKPAASKRNIPQPDQSELERKFNQYLTHSEQQNQHQAVSLLDDRYYVDDVDEQHVSSNNRVWLNRKKATTNGGSSRVSQPPTNNHHCHQQHRNQYRDVENEVGAMAPPNGAAAAVAAAAPASRRYANNNASNRTSKTAIERIMLEEKRLQQARDKERLISSSRNTGDEASLSTNASSRYIRNNSYLNANPTLNAISNGGLNPGVIYDMRSSSSNSNQSNGTTTTTTDTRPLNPKSGGSKKSSNRQQKHNDMSLIKENNVSVSRSRKQHHQQQHHHHHQQQPPPPPPPPPLDHEGYDYGSYEITV